MSMFLGGAFFPNLMNKIKLVSDNVEALTKDYENKRIDGVLCNAAPLGRQPNEGEIEQLAQNQPDYVVQKRVFSTISDTAQEFTVTYNGSKETLYKCDMNNYGYGFGGDQYCWLKASDKDIFNSGKPAKLF